MISRCGWIALLLRSRIYQGLVPREESCFDGECWNHKTKDIYYNSMRCISRYGPVTEAYDPQGPLVMFGGSEKIECQLSTIAALSAYLPQDVMTGPAIEAVHYTSSL
jgi:hypothetical protein